MTEVQFDTESLSGVRFGLSPLFEETRSVCALGDPLAEAMHMPWLEHARRLTAGLDLRRLHLLLRRGTYSPDFLNPPPRGPVGELEEELAVMVSTPPARISDEVRRCYSAERLPEELEPFLAHPKKAIAELADLLRAYWELVLADRWPRIKSLLEHDVAYRAALVADCGTRELFDDLDPSVKWRDGVLWIDHECCEASTVELDGRGLLLMPSAFAWPKVVMVTRPPWQPTLIYPARGVGMLWEPERPAPPDALSRLLGSSRAAILTALDCPRSTTELARVVDISSGGVSQHLSVLHDAGLVCRRRVRKVVLYLRSEHGEALVSGTLTPADGGPLALTS
jgi:DNA-binding transcriptional ArsR family regulator